MEPLRISTLPSKDCHNCRPRRLRCDRSLPACLKCTSSGQVCLGYGKRVRFSGAVASRGKLAGKKIPVIESVKEPGCTGSKEQSYIIEKRPSPTSSRTPSLNSNPIIPSLVDPLFNGVGYTYRHYLSYYTTRLCQDLMVVDLPNNPFRQLVTLSETHPVLQHVFVASSAAHLSNTLKLPISNTLPNGTMITKYINTEASQRAWIDALTAKQRALQSLNATLQNIEAVGSEIVLIAVLFFINLECIESGKHGWRAHLEGSGRLLEGLPPPNVSNEMFRDCIISDCYLYFTFASVFAQEPPGLSSFSSLAKTSSVIRRVAYSSLFCCPAEIMQILLAAAQLSNQLGHADDKSQSRVTEAGMDLLTRASSFDLDAWENDTDGITPGRQVKEIASRRHAAATYHLACCLYILCAVPSIKGLLPLGAEEAWEHDLTCHLSAIADEDPNFKGTVWPTFIAGAQARHPDQQAWSMDRMQRILLYLPWGFVYTAIDALQVIWTMRAEAADQTQCNWLQILKDPKINFLLI